MDPCDCLGRVIASLFSRLCGGSQITAWSPEANLQTGFAPKTVCGFPRPHDVNQSSQFMSGERKKLRPMEAGAGATVVGTQ